MVLFALIGMFGFGSLDWGYRGIDNKPFGTLSELVIGTFLLIVAFSGLVLYIIRTREDSSRKISVSNWRMVSLFLWLGIANMMVFGVPHFSTPVLGR